MWVHNEIVHSHGLQYPCWSGISHQMHCPCLLGVGSSPDARGHTQRPRLKSTKSLLESHVPGKRLNSAVGGIHRVRCSAWVLYLLQDSFSIRCHVDALREQDNRGVEAEKSDQTWRNRARGERGDKSNRNGVARYVSALRVAVRIVRNCT
jgi:hypothetical protein